MELNSVHKMVAGRGGGGVGANVATAATSGGDGDTGCGGAGAAASSQGGGGLCEVFDATAPDTQTGAGRIPHDPGGAHTPPAGTAVGGEFSSTPQIDADPGGAGHAYLTWGP